MSPFQLPLNPAGYGLMKVTSMGTAKVKGLLGDGQVLCFSGWGDAPVCGALS